MYSPAEYYLKRRLIDVLYSPHRYYLTRRVGPMYSPARNYLSRRLAANILACQVLCDEDRVERGLVQPQQLHHHGRLDRRTILITLD
jgi:hypothetical protein